MVTVAKPSLDDILAAVKKDLESRRVEKTLRQQMSLAAKRKDYRDFGMALRRISGQPLHWIGEIKRASPSAGPLRPDLDPVAIGRMYAQKGACAISILTERTYFHGTLEDVSSVHSQVHVPVLRKDFMLDEYQIVEAAACGADAVLLIAAILSFKQMERFLKVADDNSIACLTEVHTLDELNKALDAGSLILGINNRDLATLEVDLSVTDRLFSHIPAGMIAVSESGYKTREEIEHAQGLGLDAILIGETLMRSSDIERTAEELFGARP